MARNDDANREAVDAALAPWRQGNGGVMTLDDLTARDYVESDPLDLDRLSGRELSVIPHGADPPPCREPLEFLRR